MIEKPLYNTDVTVFAETNFRDQRRPFGIKRADRRRHMYLVGKSAMGKSSLMEHMIVQDIKNGEGVCVLDSTGELANELLFYIPEHRLKDVIYINPEDLDYPVAFNLIDGTTDDLSRQELTKGIVEIFKNYWSDAWGPRVEYVFQNALLALMRNENNTLLHILPLLSDPEFRAELINQIDDQALRSFWEVEFPSFPERFNSAAVEPLRDKVGQLFNTPLLRNIIGQTATGFNFEDLIAQKKIVILVLDKSKIGDEATYLLGSCFALKLWLAAKRVADQEPADFYFYADGFQNFNYDIFSELITTTRLRLNLILSNQYTAQLDSGLRRDIIGNVGTTVVFRVGAADADLLSQELAVSAEELMTLPKYKIIVQLSIDGETSTSFSATTMEPLPVIGFRDKIIAYSRKMYAHRRADAERAIMENLQVQHIISEPVITEPVLKRDDLSKFRAEIAKLEQSPSPAPVTTPAPTFNKRPVVNLHELQPGEDAQF